MRRFGKKMKSDSVVLLYRQLAVMLAVGMGVDEAFDTMGQESDNAQIRQLSALIHKDLSSGKSLQDSLTKHPKIFNDVLVGILSQEKLGENVTKALSIIADATESSGDMKSRFLQALFFPVATFIAATLACGVIMVFVVPVFKDMFAGFGGTLPVPTQLVVNTSDWIVGNFLFIFIGIIVLIACLKNQKIRYKMASTIPGLRGLLGKSSIIQYARHLSIMLSLDVPLREAFSSAAESLNNPIYSERLKNVGRTLPDTAQLKEEMRGAGIFPSIILKMVDTGETSDSLELVFKEISKFYEKDFDRSLHRMVSSLEILAVIFVGIFVGGIVISMYLPIFKMGGALV